MLEILDSLEDSLKLAVIDENWKNRVGRQTELREKFNAPDLTVRLQGPFQIINVEGHEITIGAFATDEQIAAEINRARRTKVSLKDRLQEKARLASSIVSSEVKALEEGMDAIIAEKDAVAQKRQAAIAATSDVLGVVKEQWDGIKSSVDILSNGAPE